MFYTFNQSNCSFDFDKERGITIHVIVEAESVADAVARAESFGLYFDEVGDCPCCSDRWYEPLAGDETEEPEVYGKHPSVHVEKEALWQGKGEEVCIHYLDGHKEWF